MKTYEQFMEEAPKQLKFKNHYHGTHPNSESSIRSRGFWDSTKGRDGKKGSWDEKGRVFTTPDKKHAASRGRKGPAAKTAAENSKVLTLKVSDRTDARQMPKPKDNNYTLSQKDADNALKTANLDRNKIKKKKK